MAYAILFYVCAAAILLFGILVITARNTVHSVLFLVVNFFFVAAIYVMLGAEFLAAIQVLVYAGGIVVLYLFVVMLVNLKRPPEAHRDPHRQNGLAIVTALTVLAELAAIVLFGYLRPGGAPSATAAVAATTEVTRAAGGNTQAVGYALYQQYLIPFEVASILLLVAMIGAIVLAKREI